MHDGIATQENPSLVVMLKAPANAKRRLAAEIGDLAGEAASHLLACALEDALAWPGPTWLSPARPAGPGLAIFRNPAPKRCQWPPFRQSTAATGDRDEVSATHGGKTFACHCATRRQSGRTSSTTWTANCANGESVTSFSSAQTVPALTTPISKRPLARSEDADAVLGPASDGGVVLMGARRRWPELRALSWSTRALCSRNFLSCAAKPGGGSRRWTPARTSTTCRACLAAGLTLMGDQRPSRRRTDRVAEGTAWRTAG